MPLLGDRLALTSVWKPVAGVSGWHRFVATKRNSARLLLALIRVEYRFAGGKLGDDDRATPARHPAGPQAGSEPDGHMTLVRAVASAPLTFAWLLALFVTTRIQRSAGKHGSRRIQKNHSTNLRRLRTEPARVLATSLFWLDDRRWWPYVPVFVGVLAPAERRLRWRRWLLSGGSAHVIATFVGQAYLRHSINTSRAPRRLVNARDVGVSYFVFGVAGAGSRCIQPPWRQRCQAVTLAALVVNVAVRPTFTEVGHLTAFGVGLVGGADPGVYCGKRTVSSQR